MPYFLYQKCAVFQKIATSCPHIPLPPPPKHPQPSSVTPPMGARRVRAVRMMQLDSKTRTDRHRSGWVGLTVTSVRTHTVSSAQLIDLTHSERQ